MQKECKTWQSCQQAVLIQLINSCMDITIDKQKIMTKSLPFIIVQSFSNETSERVDLGEFCFVRSKEKCDIDLKNGIHKDLAFRRMRVYEKVENMNIIIDVLSEFGFFFNCHCVKGKKGSPRCDAIDYIFFHDKVIMDRDEIINLGSRIIDVIVTNTSTGIKVFKRGELKVN